MGGLDGQKSFAGKMFIFIAGHHRSGTTLLYRMIRDHPDVTGFSGATSRDEEGQHLQSVYLPASRFGGPGRFIFDQRSHMDSNHALAHEGTAEAIVRQWAPLLDASKGWVVEKSPPNIVRSRFLQSLFPNSVFIVLRRHPVAVAYATQKMQRYRSDIVSLLDHTLLGYEIQERDLVEIDRYCVVKYEDLVDNPCSSLRDIFSCAGLPFEGYMLKRSVDKGCSEGYFRRWREEKGFLMSDRLLCHFRSRCEHFGYCLD